MCQEEQNAAGQPDVEKGSASSSAERMHVPVLVDEALQYLFGDVEVDRDSDSGVWVDCTLGLGGHAEAMLERYAGIRVLGIDRDATALELSRRRLSRFGERFSAAWGRFDELPMLLEQAGLQRVQGILADLGVSSMQLDVAERGFSFRSSGPLDMRMDTSNGPSAARVVNEYSEERLVKILREYGEERRARRIAKSIVERRKEAPLETTAELKEAVHSVSPPSRRPGRNIDPATRTFQALRIEVNQELAGLQAFMDQSVEMLDQEGRLVVISYHSLEDRIVKHSLRRHSIGEVDPTTGRERAETRLVELLTKKPVRPSEAEVQRNPRARSARLRAARRL